MHACMYVYTHYNIIRIPKIIIFNRIRHIKIAFIINKMIFFYISKTEKKNNKTDKNLLNEAESF